MRSRSIRPARLHKPSRPFLGRLCQPVPWILALVIVGAVPRGAAGQNLIVNGSFETPVLSVGAQGTDTFATISGWTRVAGSTIEIQSSALKAGACTPNTAADGNQWWEGAGDNATTLQQTVATTTGQTYRLSLAYAPRNLAAATNRLNVIWNGTVALTISLPNNGTCNSAFQTFTVNVVATSTSSIVQLAYAGPANATEGSEVDNVTLVALPPDLRITKAHSGNFVQGQSGNYTLTVANVGTGPTFGTVSVADTVPAGMTVTAMSGTGWSCTVSTSTCTRTDAVAANSSYPAITVTASVASATPPGVLTNTAVVSTTGDTNASNDGASDPTTILGIPDLTVGKTHSGSFVRGQIGTYTLTVSNIGTAATTGLVTISDTLPTGLTLSDIQGPGWICTAGTVSCTRSDGLAAGSSYAPVTIRVNVLSGAPASVTNAATVTGGNDTNSTNNTAQDSTPVVDPPVGPDLIVSKSHSLAFVQGQTGAYTVTVTNAGGTATTGQVTVTDNPPVGLTIAAFSGSGWTCSVPSRTCSRQDALPPTASYPDITVTVNVAGNAAASLTNVVTVSGGGDSNPANDTASDPTTITATPPPVDLTLTKLHSGAFERGQSGRYTLTVVNKSAGTSSGTVQVVESPPAGLTVTSIGGDGWACTLSTLTCSRADALAPGESFTPIVVEVSVASAASASVTNYATVSGGGDSNAANNKASDKTAITDPPSFPDLTVVKTHNATFLRGQSGDYTVVVTNLGAVASSGLVSVTDTLPGGMTATAMSGSGWTCVVATRVCSRSDALGPGASFAPILVTVSVAANMALGVSANTVVVTGGSDSNSANNTAVDSTLITAPPAFVDLTLTKTHTGHFTVGQPGSYTLTVTNASAMASSGLITVTDTLPGGMTATGMSGTGWTCVLATLACTRSDVIPAGVSAPPIIVAVVVGSTTPTGSISNSAAVSGGGDTDPTNNSSADSTLITAPPALVNLTLTKTHTGHFMVGQPGSYTLTVTNPSATASSGLITVTDNLPAGMTATAMSGAGWTCVLATVACTRSDVIPAGASAPPIILAVLVGSTTPAGSVSNAAAVAGGGDTDSTNNTSTDPTTIDPVSVPTMNTFETVLLLLGLLILGMRMTSRQQGFERL